MEQSLYLCDQQTNIALKNHIHIHVEKFGPVKAADITLNNLVLFSGASGLGKSYLAMLVHFVYRVVCGYELLGFKRKETDFDALKAGVPDDDGVILRLQSADIRKWINRQAVLYMRQTLGNPDFNASIDIDMGEWPAEFVFFYSRNVLQTGGSDEMVYRDTLRLFDDGFPLNFSSSSIGWSNVPFVVALREYFQSVYGISCTDTFFMPPSRGSLVAVPDYIVKSVKTNMGMYGEFLDGLSQLKSATTHPRKANFGDMDDVLHRSLLHGDVNVEDGELRFSTDDGAKLPIAATASSVKELAPLALMIRNGQLGAYATLFEEPEAHLHPEMQVRVAELLCMALKAGAHLQITTHSDYFLRAVNDMILLGMLKEKMGDDVRFKAYCADAGFNAEAAIPVGEVSAYYVKEGDGGSEVVRQDLSLAVPFDTFDSIIRSQMPRSAKLYDDVEYYCDSLNGRDAD